MNTIDTLHNEHWYRIYPPADEKEQTPLRGKLCLTYHTFTQTIDAFFYDVDDGRFVLVIRGHITNVDTDTAAELLTMCVPVADLRKTLPGYSFELLPPEKWPVEPEPGESQNEISYPDEEETILY